MQSGLAHYSAWTCLFGHFLFWQLIELHIVPTAVKGKFVFQYLLINLFHSIFLLKYIFQKTQIVHKSMIHYCNSQ